MPPIVRLVVSVAVVASAFWTISIPVLAAPPQDDARAQAVALYRDGKYDEAIEAFDALLSDRPDDSRLKILKSQAVLDKVRLLKDAKAEGYKDIVVRTYVVLRGIGLSNSDNPDWYLAVAKAYWLNDRPGKARKTIERALFYRSNFPEALLLQADIALEEAEGFPAYHPGNPGTNPRTEKYREAASAYRKVIEMPDLRPSLRAEALCKMGDVESALRDKKDSARSCWEKAVEAAPDSRYGKTARQRLGAKP